MHNFTIWIRVFTEWFLDVNPDSVASFYFLSRCSKWVLCILKLDHFAVASFDPARNKISIFKQFIFGCIARKRFCLLIFNNQKKRPGPNFQLRSFSCWTTFPVEKFYTHQIIHLNHFRSSIKFKKKKQHEKQ